MTLRDFNFTMDKMDKDGENKTQRVYRCCSNYALSKSSWVMGLRIFVEGKNPDSLQFTRYDRSFGKDPG